MGHKALTALISASQACRPWVPAQHRSHSRNTSAVALNPFGSTPRLFRHGFYVPYIGEGLDLFELLFTEGAVIEDVRPEDGATLATEEIKFRGLTK